jgi:hypothetical protein
MTTEENTFSLWKWFEDILVSDSTYLAELDRELMKQEGRYTGSYVPPEESTDGYYDNVLPVTR